MELARTEGSMFVQDVRSFRETGKWHKQLYAEDLSERNSLANALVSRLVVRVRDDAVRHQVQSFRDRASRVFASSSHEEGERAHSEMSTALDLANQRIGQVLRTLDEVELGLTKTW